MFFFKLIDRYIYTCMGPESERVTFWRQFFPRDYLAKMTKTMARPCKPDTVQFRRKLTPVQRAVILAAGEGDMTMGFHELLALYSHLHAIGYRPGMRPDSVGLITNGSVK